MAITLEELNSRVEALENKQVSLPYPLDYNSQQVISRTIDTFLPDKVYRANNETYFKYFTFFESLDGWGLTDTSGGSSGIGFQSVNLTTGTTLNQASSIGKDPIYQDILSYDAPAEFKTAFQLGVSVANVEFFAGIGVGGNGAATNHYGVLAINNNLYGVVNNGGTQQQVLIASGLLTTNSYLVKVQFFPGDKVIFYVKDTTDNVLKEKGIITTNLPTDVFTNWAFFEVVNKVGGGGSAKTVNFSFMEYTQKIAQV